MSDATITHAVSRQRRRAYRRLDLIRKRIKRERIIQLFHGEESFAGYIAGIHLEALHRQRADLVDFLDRD